MCIDGLLFTLSCDVHRRFYAQAWSAVAPTEAADATSGSPVSAEHPRPELRNLILVACHAVFTGSDYTKAEDQGSWLLLDYQKVSTDSPELKWHRRLTLCSSVAMFRLHQA